MNKHTNKQRQKLSLKGIRKKQNLSQEYVAQYLKISRPRLDSIEKGKKEPTFSQLLSFVELYKVEIDELVEGAQDKWDEIMKNVQKDNREKRSLSLIKLGQKFGSVPHKAKKQEKELKQKKQDKLKEVVLYTLSCIGHMKEFKAVRLRCILYFIESHYYRQYKLRLMNVPFYKTLQSGPYIVGLEKTIKKMISDKDIKLVKTILFDGSYNINYLVLREINFKKVSANELMHIDCEIAQLKFKPLIMEHLEFMFFGDDFPWTFAKDNNEIDFTEHLTN